MYSRGTFNLAAECTYKLDKENFAEQPASILTGYFWVTASINGLVIKAQVIGKNTQGKITAIQNDNNWDGELIKIVDGRSVYVARRALVSHS